MVPEPETGNRIELIEPDLPPGPVIIGLLIPLSGSQSELGNDLLNAAQLALFEIGDANLVMVPRDTGGTPEGAAHAASDVIAEGASLILGPWYGESATAVAPLARASGVTVVSFSSDRTVAGRGVYVMGFLPAQQVSRVVTHAYTNEISRFAAIAPDNRYGSVMINALNDMCAGLGCDVARVAIYPPMIRGSSDVTDLLSDFADFELRKQALEDQREILEASDNEFVRAALHRLENRETLGDVDYEAVLIADAGTRLRAVAPLLPFYDVDPAKVRFLGNMQWDDSEIADEPALLGAWYAAPPRNARDRFMARFEETYGYRPQRLATLAYDGLALAGALARLPDGPDYSTEALIAASGFRGVDGLFRFSENGGIERGLAVYEITASGPKQISPAPETFSLFGVLGRTF